MKSNLLFTAIILLMFTENTFSQEYHPLLNNSSWLIYDWVSCCRPSRERVIEEGTDEVIGSVTYKKYSYPSFEDEAPNTIINYLREDIIEKKVYKLESNSEVLIYDFSLELGDTIFQYGNNFVVTDVQYINVEGGTRKKIILQSIEIYCFSHLSLTWIEGVGSPRHPFYPDYNMYIDCSAGGGYNIVTKCSFQNGEHIYGNPDCATFLNINQQNQIASNINFSPNPFTATLNINSEIGFQDVTLKIFNSIGQLVRENNNLKGQNIKFDRENLQSGLYLIQLFENNKLLKTSTVLMAD